MQNILEYLIFLFFSFLVRLTGLAFARRLTLPLSYFVYYFIPIRKETVFENLAIAFPDLTFKEKKDITVKCYRSFLITLFEILYIPSLSKKQLEKLMDSPNNNLIVDKYNEGRGVILLSAHFANWEYLAMSVASQIGIPFNVIIKDQRNGYVSKWLNDNRIKFGNNVVPLGISIRHIYKNLIDKNIVALVADQRGPSDGVRVPLFGKPAAIYTGPALLAIKTGAPLLFGVATRQKDFSYKVRVEEISKENLPEDQNEAVVELSRRHSEFLENIIRSHPEQWLWMHKRWKY